MARKKKKRIASRGSVNTTILKTLINGDKYGYEIIKEVEEYSEGKIVLKQPSLYSSLSRFEEKGIVSSYWGDSDIGGRRHYYHLTDVGHKYYNENVLKIKSEDIDLGEENEKEEDVEHSLTPINNEEIPAVINFDAKEKEEVLPDHNFYTQTPIDSEDQQKPENNEEYEIIKRLATKVKSSNKKVCSTPLHTLHVLKPKKSQKVILDSDGIFKLRDEDYVAKKEMKKENIIDNVIKRTPSSVYGYPTYTETKQSPTTSKELTEEEKKLRNQLFVEKFNNLTKSKMKVVEPKPAVETKEIEKEIDYRGKLDAIIETQKKSPTPVNNLYNYDEEDEEIVFQQSNGIEEDEEDKFIDFEPTEFDIKHDDSHYAEEISNITTNNSVKLNRYEHRSKPVVDEKNYVLINKVRLIFGLILGLFLTAELIISYFVFRNYGLLHVDDKKVFISFSILSFVLVLAYIIPYFINKSLHTYNNFRLKYSVIFGLLIFLVMLIMIYCVNALMGFELDNFKYFAVKLLVPAILSFNFVFMPIIYGGLIKNKNFYD